MLGVLALLVPLVPGVIWLALLYRTDKYEPEPKRLVALTYVLGVIAIVPAFIGERLGDRLYPYLRAVDAVAAMPEGLLSIDPLPLAIGCFLIIGPCEELAKFLAVRLVMYRSRE